VRCLRISRESGCKPQAARVRRANDSGTSENSSNTGRARYSSNHLAQPVGRRAIRHTRRIVGTLILDARAEFISPIPGRSRWCGVASRICIICLDRQGRLNTTTLTGVQVFDAGGQYLGTIKVPRQPANCGVRRTGQTDALQHRTRRALWYQGAFAETGSGREMIAVPNRCHGKNSVALLIGCILAGFERGASC
jgi:hypothetical protein